MVEDRRRASEIFGLWATTARSVMCSSVAMAPLSLIAFHRPGQAPRI
jgi:hypothetical protein